MKALIDLHCHSLASGHAYSTIEEMARQAKEKNLKVMGIADHAPAMPGSPHIFYFSNSIVLPKELYGVILLKGVEANIMDYDGNLDMPELILKKLDYAIASLHPPCIESGTMEENTRAVVNAIKNPYVKVLGHPDDSRYKLDYESVVKTAKENNVAIEINNSSLKTTSFREGAWENVRKYMKICKEKKAKVIFNSDAHFSHDIGEFYNCQAIVKELDFPIDLIVNYHENDINKLLDKNVF